MRSDKVVTAHISTTAERGRRATGPADLRRALAELGRIASTVEALRMDVQETLEEAEGADDVDLSVYVEAAAEGMLEDAPSRAEREADERDIRDLLATERSRS